MAKLNPSVDGFIRKNKEWSEALSLLRDILNDSPLTEEIKWRVPCYTFNGKNVAFIGAFKDSAVLSFVKGALLKDPKNILIQQTENSQSVRVIYFPEVQAITKLKSTLKAYIKEAIDNEKAGKKVDMKAKDNLVYPEELEAIFKEMPELKQAFESLTPGRQRRYNMFFTGAKQSQTRTARIEKYIDTIMAGKGMDDD